MSKVTMTAKVTNHAKKVLLLFYHIVTSNYCTNLGN